MGAEVLLVDRTASSGLGVSMDYKYNLLHRSRRSLALDLKRP
jgi:alpha-methylacyl-CoA racemase